MIFDCLIEESLLTVRDYLSHSKQYLDAFKVLIQILLVTTDSWK
jgi:hypothetical protein